MKVKNKAYSIELNYEELHNFKSIIGKLDNAIIEGSIDLNREEIAFLYDMEESLSDSGVMKII